MFKKGFYSFKMNRLYLKVVKREMENVKGNIPYYKGVRGPLG